MDYIMHIGWSHYHSSGELFQHVQDDWLKIGTLGRYLDINVI